VIRCLSVVALIALPLAAQTQIVSPTGYADVEGGLGGNPPLTGVQRYQQIHGDVRGGVVRAIALRREGTAFEDPRYVARTIDAELVVAGGNAATAGRGFAANYATPAVVAIARTTLQLPSRVAQPPTRPAPFDVVFPFAAPFVVPAQTDFLWELAVHAASTQPYPTDIADGASQVTFGSTIRNGVGCTTANGTMELHVGCDVSAIQGRSVVTLLFTTLAAPSFAPAAVVLGVGNPDLPLPGFCARIHVVPALVLPVQVDGAGDSRLIDAFPLGQAAPGQWFDAQTVAIDPSQPAVQLALTNGVSARVNAPRAPFPVVSLIATGAANATSGQLRPSYAAVVRLDR
jgi:hypothetical protein